MARRFRLPSVAATVRAARSAGRRFPAVVLAALLATFSAIQLIAPGADGEPWVRLLVASLLGMPLGVALTTTLERRSGADRSRLTGAPATGLLAAPWLGLALSAAVAGAFWLAWPRWTETIALTRFAHLALLFHLLVACLPFLRSRTHQAFWQYNRRILYRWLEGGIYAASLFLGLALALAALDQLFGVEVPEEMYGYLWALCAMGFHPLFFLAGAPADLGALERDESYPSWLRAFANFVLVPLTLLYLLILTAYFVKVIVTGQWPSGWIGWLVSGAATLGILTLLLTSPPAAVERPAWVRQFERWFWPALLPAALMVGLAVWQRVAQYGLTERRYFLAALALWLGGVALAFTLRRARPLILIPASLAGVALLTFAGPWGAYRSSERSQLGRLERLLSELGMLTSGRITPAAGSIDRERAVQAANVAAYLAETRGARRFGRWLEARGVVVQHPEDSLALVQPTTGRERPGAPDRESREREFQRAALAALGLSGLARRPQEMVWVPAPPGLVLDVHGWEHLVPLAGPVVGDRAWPRGDSLAGRLGVDGRSVELRRGGVLLLRVELGDLFDSLAAWRLGNPPEQTVPDSLLIREDEGAGVAVLVRIRRAGLRDSAGVWRASSFEGEALIRFP